MSFVDNTVLLRGHEVLSGDVMKTALPKTKAKPQVSRSTTTLHTKTKLIDAQQLGFRQAASRTPLFGMIRINVSPKSLAKLYESKQVAAGNIYRYQ